MIVSEAFGISARHMYVSFPPLILPGRRVVGIAALFLVGFLKFVRQLADWFLKLKRAPLIFSKETEGSLRFEKRGKCPKNGCV